MAGKTKQAEAFKLEQAECLDRLQKMTAAVKSGDVCEINRWFESVGTSVVHLNVNDPRRPTPLTNKEKY